MVLTFDFGRNIIRKWLNQLTPIISTYLKAIFFYKHEVETKLNMSIVDTGIWIFDETMKAVDMVR